MASKIKICVDMDDTIENLLEVWIGELNNKYNKSLTLNDITNWDISLCSGLTKEEVISVLFDLEVYKKITPYTDAQEYLKLLNDDERFEIYIATNTYYKTYSYKMEEVLFRYFPFIDTHRLICIPKKQMLKCDLLIDDYHNNLIGGEYDKILIDKPYNRECETTDITENQYHSQNIKRANNWKEIYDYIIKKTKRNLW